MKNEDFNVVVKSLFDLCQMTLIKTEKGYTVDKEDDRLRFFKTCGAMDGESPERALKGMWKKHLMSVFEIIKWVDDEPERLNMDVIQEKIHDSINYHALLFALLVERLEATPFTIKNEPALGEPWVNAIPDTYGPCKMPLIDPDFKED